MSSLKIIFKYIITVLFFSSAVSCADAPNRSCFDGPFDLLIGNWKLVELSSSTFSYPHCDSLKNGSRFVFACDSRMFVYDVGKHDPCTDWKFGYALKDSMIEMWQGDALFYYEIDELSEDTLKISKDEKLTFIRLEPRWDLLK